MRLKEEEHSERMILALARLVRVRFTTDARKRRRCSLLLRESSYSMWESSTRRSTMKRTSGWMRKEGGMLIAINMSKKRVGEKRSSSRWVKVKR